MEIDAIVGLTVTHAFCNEIDDKVGLKFSNGKSVIIHHVQDCCESVGIQEVFGDVLHLIGRRIASATEECTQVDPTWYKKPMYRDSYTWTIQKIIADDGVGVTIFWLGESNGYYGETPSVLDATDRLGLFENEDATNIKPQIEESK